MNSSLKRFLFWTPRVLAAAFALFISIFALDVFEEGKGFWETAVALGIHLLPTLVLLIVLVATWRREWVGGIIYPIIGIAYLVAMGGRVHWIASVVIAGPLLITGGLFLYGWYRREALQH